jgi:hypothetical protein
LIGCPALIIWLGGDAIGHIGELYDGLCPGQGPSFARLLYDGNPQGYCTGIGSDLAMLSFIMVVAAIAMPSALGGFWYYCDRSRRDGLSVGAKPS